MKKVATDEDEAIISIPEVVRVAVVAVEPAIIVVVFDIEHIEVAVRVRCVWRAVCATTPRILSGLNRIRHHNALARHTK